MPKFQEGTGLKVVNIGPFAIGAGQARPKNCDNHLMLL
jgi:hypothetical protein